MIDLKKDKYCLFDNEKHKIISVLEKKEGGNLVELESDDPFPRRYFVDESKLQPIKERMICAYFKIDELEILLDALDYRDNADSEDSYILEEKIRSVINQEKGIG